MSKILYLFVAVAIFACTFHYAASRDCSKAPADKSTFKQDKTCSKGPTTTEQGVQWCCQCKDAKHPQKPATGYYKGPANCPGQQTSTTTAGTTTGTTATTTTSGSTTTTGTTTTTTTTTTAASG